MKEKKTTSRVLSSTKRGFVFLSCFLSLLLGSVAYSFSAMAQSSITLTTNKAVGEKIKLRIYIEPKTSISIDGVEEEFENAWKEYTLNKQEVTITGVIKRLFCSNNQITSIDTKNAPELQAIICSYNEIQSLDFSQNSEIKSITCIQNKLESINVTGIEKLEFLSCERNNLETIDVTTNSKLSHLGVGNNKLKKIDVTQNKLLVNLFCENNELSSLDLAGLSNLIYINCFGNKIKGKAMSDLVASLPERTLLDEAELRIINSKGSTHDNHCMKKDALVAEEKCWSVMDYNGGNKNSYAGTDEEPQEDTEQISFVTERPINTSISMEIEAEGEVTFEGLDGTYKKGWENYTLRSPNVVIKGKIKKLNCSILDITAIDVTKATSLEEFDCSTNKLTSIDISKNANLQYFEIYNNQLTSLNTSGNPKLVFADVVNNQITELDLSSNIELRNLSVYFNKIKKPEMKKLLSSLRTIEGDQAGELILINSVPSVGQVTVEEQNEYDQNDLAIGKEKNWDLFDWNGGHKKELIAAPLGNGVMTFRTKKTAGQKIAIDLGPEETPAVIEGVEETYVPGSGLTEYTLKGSEVTIRGDLSVFSCHSNEIESIRINNPALRLFWGFHNEIKEIEITPSPELKRILLSKNQLSTFTLADCPLLESIDLKNNKLTSITLSGCPKLNTIFCFKNQLNEDNSKKLIEALPAIPDGSDKGILVIVDTEARGIEKNVCSSTLVTLANTKNWEVRDNIGDTQGENGVLFPGTDLANEEIGFAKVNCYTTPTTDALFIEGANPNDRIIIYALDGSIVYQATADAPQMRIDMNNYPSGAYLVRVEAHTQKVMKK